VALARALAREPRVLLLDEPFAALDAITRRQVRDELADLLATLRLPTVLVTHSFDDATVVADRIAVLDDGHLAQVARASELLRDPATALVAALTGANVLQGTATPCPSGSTVRLSGGGELVSSTSASGPVQVVVQPWELEPVDPESSTLTDNVVKVRHDHGRLLIRLTRFSIQTEADVNGRQAITEGRALGLRVEPANVRVLGPAPRT